MLHPMLPHTSHTTLLHDCMFTPVLHELLGDDVPGLEGEVGPHGGEESIPESVNIMHVVNDDKKKGKYDHTSYRNHIKSNCNQGSLVISHPDHTIHTHQLNERSVAEAMTTPSTIGTSVSRTAFPGSVPRKRYEMATVKKGLRDRGTTHHAWGWTCRWVLKCGRNTCAAGAPLDGIIHT